MSCEPIYPASIFPVSRTFKSEFPPSPDHAARLVRALAFLGLFLLVPTVLRAQGDTTFTAWLRFRGTPRARAASPASDPGEPVGGRPAAEPQTGRARLGTARWHSGSIPSGPHGPPPGGFGRSTVARRSVPEDSLQERRGLLGLSRRYADLDIDGHARIEIRTERLKNLRCTPAQFLDLNSGCRGGFKTPRLDTYLALRAGGLIGRRLHVDVDYDTERDFTARNNIQLYYEGLEDEIVRRVEVGTVTFRPPASRFLTASIPANNFGVNATFEVGALTLQGIAATQKGSVVAERTYTVGSTTVQPQDREVRDLDFEGGPVLLGRGSADHTGVPRDRHPAAQPGSLPPTAIINQGEVRVYRYRPLSGNGVNPNLGGINALAISTDFDQRCRASGSCFQRDIDYYVDPSGLWIALAAKLDVNDFLAVSYRSQAGQVGTFPAQDGGLTPGQPPRDTLRLIVKPNVDASRATFRHEMRQVYRVAGADLDLNSLKVNLSLNRSESSAPTRGAADLPRRAGARDSRPIPTSSTGRTGSFPGPEIPMPRSRSRNPTSSSRP